MADSSHTKKLPERCERDFKEEEVVVYGSFNVQESIDASNLLETEGGYSVHYVDESDLSEEELKSIKTYTGYETFPLIFVKGKFVGGYSELKAQHEKTKISESLYSMEEISR